MSLLPVSPLPSLPGSNSPESGEQACFSFDLVLGNGGGGRGGRPPPPAAGRPMAGERRRGKEMRWRKLEAPTRETILLFWIKTVFPFRHGNNNCTRVLRRSIRISVAGCHIHPSQFPPSFFLQTNSPSHLSSSSSPPPPLYRHIQHTHTHTSERVAVAPSPPPSLFPEV